MPVLSSENFRCLFVPKSNNAPSSTPCPSLPVKLEKLPCDLYSVFEQQVKQTKKKKKKTIL
jgi:hypothetical protein